MNPNTKKKESVILYKDLSEEALNEVDQRIISLKASNPPHTLKEIISTIRSEMNVVIQQHHIYKALKSAKNVPISEIPVIHAPEEIQLGSEEPKPFSIQELIESIGYYTRFIQFLMNDEPYMFYIIRLTEAKKYGSKTSEKLNEQMELCQKQAYSLRDNLVFPYSKTIKGQGRLSKKEKEEGLTEKIIEKQIPAGIKRGFIKVDSDGNYVSNKEVQEVNLEGQPLEVHPSSLYFKNSPNHVELGNSITLNEALDHDINAQYILIPEEEGNDSKLKALMHELEDAVPPRFLALPFCYYPSTIPQDAFLQFIKEKETEYILMNVGVKINPQLMGLEEIPEEIIDLEGEEFEDLELDFHP